MSLKIEIEAGLNRILFAETKEHVNVDEWLDVWGELLNKARHLESLPLWLQYFPKILFQVINKSGTFPTAVFALNFSRYTALRN